MTRTTPETVVRAIITNQLGDTLFLRKKESSKEGSLWELPGGKVNKDEDPKEALFREIKEETGLVLDHRKPVYKLFDIEIHYPYQQKEDPYLTRVLGYFIGFTGWNDILLSEEHTEYSFFSGEKILDLDIATSSKFIWEYYERKQ